MPRVKHIPERSPWPNGYSSADVPTLPPGGEAEVEPRVARYLISTFPQHFVLVGGESGEGGRSRGKPQEPPTEK